MTWAVDSRGSTSPGSPTPSDTSQLSALISQKSDDTVGAPHAVSAQERVWYYNGVTDDGDQPELLYRTSSETEPWVASTSRFAHPPIKFPRPVHGTLLQKKWDIVGSFVDDLVCAIVSRCYSIDPVRFFTVPQGEDVKNGTLGSAVIWVTVHPDSKISVDTAHKVSQFSYSFSPRMVSTMCRWSGVRVSHPGWQVHPFYPSADETPLPMSVAISQLCLECPLPLQRRRRRTARAAWDSSSTRMSTCTATSATRSSP